MAATTWDMEMVRKYFTDNDVPFESLESMHEAFSFLCHEDGFLVLRVGNLEKIPASHRPFFTCPGEIPLFGLIYTHHYHGHVLPLKNDPIRWQRRIMNFAMRVGDKTAKVFRQAYTDMMVAKQAERKTNAGEDAARAEEKGAAATIESAPTDEERTEALGESGDSGNRGGAIGTGSVGGNDDSDEDYNRSVGPRYFTVRVDLDQETGKEKPVVISPFAGPFEVNGRSFLDTINGKRKREGNDAQTESSTPPMPEEKKRKCAK